jgi:hypothetical protein
MLQHTNQFPKSYNLRFASPWHLPTCERPWHNLSQGLSQIVAHAFKNKVINRFGALAKIFTNQGMKFCGDFQQLCQNSLINHCTTLWDYFEANGLIDQMMHVMKQGLQKYGFQKCHTEDWELQLPWLTMGYRLSWHVFFSYFSPYFVLFGLEVKLWALIQWDLMLVINLDDLNVWIQACEL